MEVGQEATVMNLCRWPELSPPYDGALREAVELILEQVPDILGIVASGTIVRGTPSASSDLDIYVIRQQLVRQRLQRWFNGVPAEIFINPPEKVRDYLRQEHTTLQPITAHMITTGFVVLDRDPVIEELRVLAQTYLDCLPELSTQKLTQARYMAATRIEDATDIVATRPEAARMLLNLAVRDMLRYRFMKAGAYVPRDKDLITALNHIDESLAALARDFYRSADLAVQVEHALEIADLTIETHGFFAWSSTPEEVNVEDETLESTQVTQEEMPTMTHEPLMTIVIPAYNEAHRLPQTLTRVADFARARSEALDVIVVNNNSRDETGQIARSFAEKYDFIQVLDQPIQGKGAAVRKGILNATGQYAFICDADLAMPIEELPRFFPETLGEGYDLAIGSREAPGSRRYNEPFYRHLMGRGFNFIVRTLAVPGIQDTQCGFKAFRREAGQAIFSVQRINGFAFDVEILALARKWNYKILEIGIPWYYGEGGSVHPLRDSWRMFREVLRIRRSIAAGDYDPPSTADRRKVDVA